jgi:DNA-directed RNA polymerase specialized sigma24 family protein
MWSITALFYPESNELLHDVTQVSHPSTAMEDKEGLTELLRIIQSLSDKQKTAIVLTKIKRVSKEIQKMRENQGYSQPSSQHAISVRC